MKKKSINPEKVFSLISDGKNQREISAELGVSVPTLAKRIGDLQLKQGLLLKYRNIQSLQLTELQARVLEAITPDKIEEAPLKDLVLCYKILKERELVSEGKPSEIKGLVSYLVQLEKEQTASCDSIIIQEEEKEQSDMPNL